MYRTAFSWVSPNFFSVTVNPHGSEEAHSYWPEHGIGQGDSE